MHIIDTDIDRAVLKSYYDTISAHFKLQVEAGNPYMEFYPTRNIRLSNDDPLVGTVKEILERELRVRLTLSEAELQTWGVDSYSEMHVHDERAACEDYNSLLYLNHDFQGGCFFTGEGIAIQPLTGRLTFFNGKTVPHGVTPVKGKHRHTAIFWWKETRFI